MENLTGRQLGPYRVVAPLGEGGMAAVYKAYQAGMDRYVALKVLPQLLAKDPQFVGRFKQEAQVLAKLQHPHILPVFDFGESEGYTYIAMPFVESGTLTDLLTGRPLPFPQLRSLGAQVGDALDYAHTLGLVHRDVKPSNVLIDKRGNCLLTDFGIAKLVEGTAKFTNTGGIVGTPAYMSPEQGRGDKVDARTDIYSLGIMIYEMAVGRVPFDAETPIAIVFKHISDPLPLPSQINPAVPDALERVILKALTKDPAERFATAGDLVRALKAALPDAEATTGPPPVPPTRAGPARVGTLPPASARVPAAATVPAPPAPAAPKKGLPAWLRVAGGALLLVLCAALIAGGFVLRNYNRSNNRATQAADNAGLTQAAAATAKANQLDPTHTPTPQAQPTDTPAPSQQARLEILKAGPVSGDSQSKVDTYAVDLQLTVPVPAVLLVWIERFSDPDCTQAEPDAAGNTTAYDDKVELGSGAQVLSVSLSGPPAGAPYLAAGARLIDEAGKNVLVEDVRFQICFAAPAGPTPTPAAFEAHTKSPPLLDAVVQPGEWDSAVPAALLPHGLLYYLNDSDFLYLLVDVTGDTADDPLLKEAPWGDFFAVGFDLAGNKQIDVKDDVLYGLVDSQLSFQFFLGPNTFTGGLPTASKMAEGFGSTPASAAPHRFWELAISLKEIRSAPGQAVYLGLTTYSQTPSFWDEIPLAYQGDFSQLIALRLGR